MVVAGVGDLPIFPCRADKKPLVKAWPTAAKRIEPPKHWPLVGMPTGEASGISVLDIDVGGLDWFDAQALPLTRMHQTRSGGFHLLFRHPDGLRNSASQIAPGVDVRAEGGFIVWWARERLEICDAPLAEWPLGVRHDSTAHGTERAPSLSKRLQPPAVQHNVPKKLWLAIVRLMQTSEPKDRSRVRGVLKGLVYLSDGRNVGLYNAGICFRALIAEGVIGEDAAADLLMRASAMNGYIAKAGEEAAERTIQSALRSVPREVG